MFENKAGINVILTIETRMIINGRRKNDCVSLLLHNQLTYSAFCLSGKDSTYKQQQNLIYFKTNNRIIPLKDNETSVLFYLETCRHNKTLF